MTILKTDAVRNFRGRRFMLCGIERDLHMIIDNLGINDTLSEKEIPDPRNIRPAPDDPIRIELKNQATNLIRMLIAHSDGTLAAGLRYGNSDG